MCSDGAEHLSVAHAALVASRGISLALKAVAVSEHGRGMASGHAVMRHFRYDRSQCRVAKEAEHE